MNCDGVSSFDDPDHDGLCGSSDPCPDVVGTTCDTGDTGDTGTSDTSDTAVPDTSIDTSIDTAATDSTPCPPDTGPDVIRVDEEDPEIYEGGWSCNTSSRDAFGSVLMIAAFAAAGTRRKPRV
jgi:hypothetical protein